MKTHFYSKSAHRGLVQILTMAAGAAALAGCGSSSSSSLSGVSLTGSLSVPSSTNALFQLRKGGSPDQRTDFTGDSVTCSTLSTPPVTATASVSSSGSFTITIAGGVNQPMNCNLVDSSGDLLASIVTTNSTQTNMQGNPTTADTLAFSASADLGSITYDPNTGEATVPISQISESLVTQNLSPTTAFDPTGNWVIGNVDFTLPAGFVAPCPANSNNCNGPPEGQDIYLKRWSGVSTTDSSQNVYGIQIWNSQAGFQSCGSVIGLSAAQATALGIDFSSNGSALAPFTFATSISVQGTSKAITNGYQIAGAVSQYQTSTGCQSQSVTANGQTYNGYVCGPDDQGYYSANIGGGCVDSSGTPVNTNGAWTPGAQACTSADFGAGYTQWSCSGTATVNSQSVAVTCSNIGGTFTDSSLATAVNVDTGVLTTTGNFTQGSATISGLASTSGVVNGMVISNTNAVWGDGNASVTVVSHTSNTVVMSQTASNTESGGSVSFGAQFNQNFYASHTINAGTACSSMTSGSLAQEQCYANYYQQYAGNNGGSSACTPRVNADWSTTDPTRFITVSWLPNNLPLMNQLVYLSANSAASRNEQDQIQGVPSSQGGGQWTNCHVHEVDSISFTLVDSTHILAQYTASDTTSDTGIPDCVANYGDSKTKYMFTLTKQ